MAILLDVEASDDGCTKGWIVLGLIFWSNFVKNPLILIVLIV